MNREKFQRKCNELIDYEDAVFENIPKLLLDLNNDLKKIGLLIKVERWWSFPKSKPLLERPNILKGYCNNIDVFFIRKKDEVDQKGEFLCLSFLLTKYQVGAFSNNYYTKNKIKNFVKQIKIANDEIQKFGLREVANKYQWKTKN